MKKITNFLGTLTLALSSGTFAQGLYWGGGLGVMDFDFNNIDNPLGVGLRIGYPLYSGWGLEAEYNGSLYGGDTEVQGKEVDVDLHTLAGYGTYRSQGYFYFKGRLGLLYEHVTVGSNSSDDFGVAIGAGIGLALTANSRLELEFTQLEKDVGLWSGSFNYRF
ncbi:outer membrane beta-barrel protein [Microbulbifer sp. THAF38]|uniref:outer membrane beta-barrel protein n=1 Tax=Microbulbifer sp. THAF38 TaxID=2587856 RepID=UPI0012697EE8|nr:outer membrane beta-barrel protein [Microbulbifer sp. THAF38]